MKRDDPAVEAGLPGRRLSTAKAIPTEYCGIRFRSRLEARWFIFFERLGIKALYEHEGYQLDGAWYLPDYWLPDLKVFVEVKPTKPTAEERAKCEALARHTACDVVLVIGEPCTFLQAFDRDHTASERWFADAGWDSDYYVCMCKFCRRFGWQYQGRWTRIDCGCNPTLKAEVAKGKEGRDDVDRSIRDAAEFAANYQFRDGR